MTLLNNESMLDYINNKKKAFLEQYRDISFLEYLEDVYHYSIEDDDINYLAFIGKDLINEFNQSLLKDEIFLEFPVLSHFRDSKKKDIFCLYRNQEIYSLNSKITIIWFALVVHPNNKNIDIAFYEHKNWTAVLDSDFVEKPLSYLIEHLKEENKIYE